MDIFKSLVKPLLYKINLSDSTHQRLYKVNVVYKLLALFSKRNLFL